MTACPRLTLQSKKISPSSALLRFLATSERLVSPSTQASAASIPELRLAVKSYSSRPPEGYQMSPGPCERCPLVDFTVETARLRDCRAARQLRLRDSLVNIRVAKNILRVNNLSYYSLCLGNTLLDKKTFADGWPPLWFLQGRERPSMRSSLRQIYRPQRKRHRVLTSEALMYARHMPGLGRFISSFGNRADSPDTISRCTVEKNVNRLGKWPGTSHSSWFLDSD